jgi:hypothetical protein
MSKKLPAKKAAPKKAVSKKSSVKAAAKPGKSAKPVAKSGKPTKPTKASATRKTKKSAGAAAAPAAPTKPEVSLGRPLVTQEEKLFMLFHDDYQARQVFEFLRVETVKELEQFSQQQIVHMMSKPLRMTVDRIRQRLAQYKRSLKDDEQFAADFQRMSDKQENK